MAIEGFQKRKKFRKGEKSLNFSGRSILLRGNQKKGQVWGV